MSLTPEQLTQGLPSPFYRVATKALVFDDQNRVLVALNSDDGWELPGGGWEHDEGLAVGMDRELHEELGVGLKGMPVFEFTFRGTSKRGWHVLRLVYRVSLDSTAFTPGDGMTEARFVTKEELLQLQFSEADQGIKECVSQIWPPED